MKRAVSLVLAVMTIISGMIISSATAANLKTTLTDYTGQGGLSYTSTRLMSFDNTTGINKSAMSATPSTDRSNKKQGMAAISVTSSADNSRFVALQTNVGAFDFTVTDPYAQNLKMWVYVSDCDLIACDHDAVYDTPQEDSFTFYVTLGNSTSTYNYTVQHTMHGSGWQEIDINFATDNVTHSNRKNINWNFRYMQIWCNVSSGVTIKFDELRLIQYSTTYEMPECENNGRWISTCDYNALDGGIITEWYGSSFDLNEKTQGTSSLRIDGYQVHVDYRVTLSGLSTKAYYDTDVFCMDMYIDDIKKLSTAFEARVGENEAGSQNAFYGFSYPLMNRYANGGEGLKSGWNTLQIPLSEMALTVNEDYFGDGYQDLTVYKITLYNPGTVYSTRDNMYTIRYDNIYLTDKSNLDLSFAETETVVKQQILEPAANLDKIKTSSRWTKVNNNFLDNSSGIYTLYDGVVNLNFSGTEITVNSYSSYDQGKLFISLDGGDEQEVDLTNTDTYFVSGLVDAGHTLRIRAVGKAYIDSIKIYGELLDCFVCEECSDCITDVDIVYADGQKSVDDMKSTLIDASQYFFISDTYAYDAPDGCPEYAYFYEPEYGAERKSGFGINNPVVADLVGNEENWTVEGWVYISDVTSYQILLQIIPYNGFNQTSMHNGYLFANLTENWAYRYRLFNSGTGEDLMTLDEGWNYLQIPLSKFNKGKDANLHTEAAYNSLAESKTVSGITLHENSADNYGNYTLGIANMSLVSNAEHTCYVEEELPQPPAVEYVTEEIEANLDNIIVSNAWVKRYNKNLSGRYALHTTSGGKIQFSFYGTDFSIVSYKSPSQGRIYVSVDGNEEFLAADLYEEVADTHFNVTVYESGTLLDTKHTVTLRVEGKAYIDALGIAGNISRCNDAIHDDVTIEFENVLDAVYTGNWSKKYSWYHSGHNAMYNTDGGSVSFDFEGDEFSVISYKSSTQGNLYISIDGGEEVKVYLGNETENIFATEVYSVNDLDYGIHEVVIRAEGKAYIDAVVINRKSAETITYEGESTELTFEGAWSNKYAWKHSNHNAMYTSTGGTVLFTYTGYDFGILSYKAMSQGKMYVSIDGGAAIEVDLYDDSTDTLYKQTVFKAAGLDYGTHTVEIVTSGKVYLDAVQIDGIIN